MALGLAIMGKSKESSDPAVSATSEAAFCDMGMLIFCELVPPRLC